MLVSIITPTYNSGNYLEECILSIKNQSYSKYEHIIVDGGSTDDTLEIIRKHEGTYPMRWISEKDNGMYDAIAKGFKMATGDIFCWINSDDIYMPWTLKTVADVFKNSEINWCSGMPAHISKSGFPYFDTKHFITFPQYCLKRGWMDGIRLGCVQQESTFWRRNLYEIVGGIDPVYKLAGDYALWVKFAEKEKLYSLNTILAGFRIHSGQKSSDKDAYCKEAHQLSYGEKILNKVKFYKIMNFLLKRRETIIDVSNI